MKIKKSQLQTLVREIITETLQVLQEVQRGEWWIYPDGSTQFADGDVGDSNHEGYVIEQVAREIYEHFCGDAPDQMGYLGDHEEAILQALIDDDRLDEAELAIWNNEGSAGGPTEILIKKLLEDKVYASQEQASDAVYIAYGSAKDARDYAMKFLNWKRMVTTGNKTYVQTWFLRSEDLTAISRGVGDAWGDYGEEDEEDSTHEVEIEVRANDKLFSDIPLSVLDKGNIRAIIPYMKKLAWMREKKDIAPVMNPVNFT
jgi:hypothetical protein